MNRIASLVSPFNPKQPEFVLITSDYTKKLMAQYNISHFYQFTAESNTMSVIPDACIDILICKKDGKLVTKIAGTRLEQGAADTELHGEYFGVRFLPGANPVGYNLAPSELVNQELNFDDMINRNEKNHLLEQLFYADSFSRKIEIFMNYYMKYIEYQSEDRHSLKSYIRNEIIRSSGNIKLSDLSQKTGYSERYLNKKVHEDYGMNPKNLIRFIRFQKAVSNLTSTMGNTNCILAALDAGYYDQSHFNKDFKRLSGSTPINYIDHLLYHSYDQKLHIIN